MSNKKINLKKTPFIELFVFGICFIIFLYIIIPPNIVGSDSFYHAKMAKLIEERGLIKDFPWMQFTTYKDVFVDHHFGYHYILSLFLKIPSPKNLGPLSYELEPFLKTEIATAFFAALFFLALYIFLKKIKIKFPVFWTLLILTALRFIGRLSLIRAPAISIVIMLLGVYCIIKKKYLGLLLTLFIYVWFYGAWPLMFIIIFLYLMAKIIKNKSFKKIISFQNLKIIIFASIGALAGLILNPYFPKTFPFYFFQTIQIAILGPSKVAIGAEWYPPDFLSFLIDAFPIIIAWIISISWFFIKKNKQKIIHWFLFLISVFFFLFTLKSRRNIDYFIPFSIIFSGLIFSQIFKTANWAKIKKHFSKLFLTSQKQIYAIFTIIIFFILIFFTGLYIKAGVFGIEKAHENAPLISHLQAPLNWLEENSKPEKIVYHRSWDMFPALFYFNHKNYYINGLDQNFFYANNKKKYKTWLKIHQRKINPKKLGKIIKNTFNASYIISDKKSDEKADKKFNIFLEKSGLEKIYNSPNTSIYKIK